MASTRAPQAQADRHSADRIVGDIEADLLGPWLREKRGEARSDDLAGERCPTQPCVRASTKPYTIPVRAAHAEFIAALKGQPPRAIPLDVDTTDLEDRADHLNKVFNALSVYVTAILDDTAQNIPGGLDLGDVGAALSDLASDVTGTIQLAAHAMAAGRIA